MSARAGLLDRCRMVKRQWRILQYLATNRFATLHDISAFIDCGDKTIRRDLSALEEVGFPIHWVPNADGPKFIRLERNWLDLHAAPAGPKQPTDNKENLHV